MASYKFFKLTGEGALVFLRVSPGAAKDAVAGLWQGADGEQRLAVKVTTAPDKGKANAGVIKLLAKTLRLPKSALAVSAGETARMKTIAIASDPAALEKALRELIKSAY